MATEFSEKAKEAFMDDDYKLAIDFYSKAIACNPNDPNLFADRAQAYIKLSDFTAAVADAKKAIQLDPSMAKAYLRKGTACMKLEEYHTAKAALEKGASFAENDSRFTKLIIECDQYIAEEAGHQFAPSISSLASVATPVSFGSRSCNGAVGNPVKINEGCSLAHEMNSVTSVKPKYRHEYYQKPEEVVVTVFAKEIPAKSVAVEYGEQILSVTIDVPGEEAYCFQPRLFGKIIPEKCRYEVLSTKVEIRLAKVEAINWTSLEYCRDVIAPQKVNVLSGGSQRPKYPSSKSRTRDWDKLEAQVKKEEKEEKLDGDAALNKMFKDIYMNSDEDMRRAMSKSFVESNGTVLSTDWSEVGSKKVEGSAPEGMEMKKWEY